MSVAPPVFPNGLSMDQIMEAYQTFFATQTGYSASQLRTDNRVAPRTPVNPHSGALPAQRNRLNPEQARALNEKFSENPKISSEAARDLGAKIGKTEKQITNWFSYQRRKLRKYKEKEADGC